MRMSWESQEKVIRKSWESHEKVIRKSWEIYEKVMRKSWESYEKVLLSFSCRHVCSCLFARCPHTDLRVAPRPWLAFQAKGHGKKLDLINSDLKNSVLINSVLINSVLFNSVLINSVRINSVIINPVLLNSVFINSVCSVAQSARGDGGDGSAATIPRHLAASALQSSNSAGGP